MGPDFHNVQELFNFYENVVPGVDANAEQDLRSVSARIRLGSYEELGRLSERWGVSRSALAAQLLETALNELEMREEAQFSKKLQDDASKAAL